MKWKPCFLSRLHSMSVNNVSYKCMATFFDVVPSTIIQWMKKYLPDEFARRQQERGVWRPSFLSDLRAMCHGEHTFEDIGEFFGVHPSTARLWAETHLGADAYNAVARKHRWHAIDAGTAQDVIQMRIDGATLQNIADFFDFSMGQASKLLRDIPRGTPTDTNDGASSFGSEGPSLADLEELQEQVDSGELIL